jgi:diguanylate cyclase (GGDEF)-like protein
MGQGEAPDGAGDPAYGSQAAAQESETTIRLSRTDRDRAPLAKLRTTLPPLDPITEERPVLARTHDSVEGATRETPHAIVLPIATRADRATLTMLRGPAVGTTFTLAQDETVLGRGTKADIFLEEPSISREHARISRNESGAYDLLDLGSTNGSFVGGRPVHRAALKSGDRIQLGSELTFRFAILDEEEETLQRKLYESSMRDVLTGLMNRGSLFEHLTRRVERFKRDRTDVAVLIIDADHFKQVNDRFGHAAGDEVLRAIALAGMRVLGETDVFARYGGEEFAVLSRADGPQARELAEKVRQAIGALWVEVGAGAIAVTVSVGVATLSECEIVDGLELFARADARLYAAKRAGRNQVCAIEG